MDKPKLYIIGSSHAARLFKSLKLFKIRDKYDVINLAKPGSIFQNIDYPKNVKSSDIILGQLFGNDVFEKHIKITQGKMNNIIHLTKYKPIPIENLKKLFTKFVEIMSQYPCKIYLFDLILRHIGCCPAHHYPDLVKYQRQVNKDLETILLNSNIKLLNHLKYLEKQFRWTKKIENYKKMFVDTVHFYPVHYQTMVRAFLGKELNFWVQKKKERFHHPVTLDSV
jgi:hypothetical protein